MKNATIVRVPNPFKQLRRMAGLTQEQVAEQADCSRHLVIRTEQACFTDPPPVLLYFFVDHLTNQNEHQLTQAYKEYQCAVREQTGRFLKNPYELLLRDPEESHPFSYLRGSSNLTVIAKRLCMSQSTLYRFEHKPLLQKTVPHELLAALRDCGYSNRELVILESYYQEFRHHVRNSNPITSKPVTSKPVTSKPVSNQQASEEVPSQVS